jgi:hypothetical protein
MATLPRPRITFPVDANLDKGPNRSDVSTMIDALLDVLERHEARPDEGALALMTSFLQGASRILELSSLDEAEHNRASLLALLEQARQRIDDWSLGAPPSRYVM